ncbi:polyvinylalcohol dehydrogenase [Planctomycetales bacterium]|nr:polyvinylalcohol dehydrogenase [Planctomycetales bacterium]
MRRFSVILAVAAAFVFCQNLLAESPAWAVFHGVQRDNISPDTGLLKEWGANGPKLLWKTTGIGNTEFPGYSSVTIADGRLYTAGNVKVANSDQTANAAVYCLDSETGKEIWHYENGSGWTDKAKFPGERGTPTIDGDRIYAYSAVGLLACLDAKTGKKIWDRNLREDYAAQLPTWAYAESVVIDGNQVAVWVGGVKASVVALDKLTGKTIWETPSTGNVGNYASMTLFALGGIKMYANMNQKGLLIVRADNGKQLLFHSHESDHDIIATTPHYDNSTIFITGSGAGAKLLKLNVDNVGNVTADVVWAEKKFDNFHGGVIVRDGYIYGTAHKYKKGIWICANRNDGKIVWENRGVGEGSVSYADGMLYCYSETEGVAALVKPTPEGYKEVSRFTLPEEGAGKYWAHPVICGKKLYLRHAEFLYCYDIGEK